MKRPLLVVCLSTAAFPLFAPRAHAQASYEVDVKPILEKSCNSCHKAGGSQASRPLATWADVQKLKAAVAHTVVQGTMPPSGALSAADKKKLQDWQDAGFPEKAGGAGANNAAGAGAGNGVGAGAGAGVGAGNGLGAGGGATPPGTTTTPGTTAGQPTPLVLDLGGKGEIDFAAQPVTFDIYGTGEPVRVSWPVGDIAFLTLDLNGNGLVDSGIELFGDSTALLGAVDRTAEHGFAALAQYDVDKDGTIDASDPIFTRLRLWLDKNADGKTQPSEISTLADHKVLGLSLGFTWIARPGDDGVLMPLLMGRYQVETPGGGRDTRVLADIYLKIHER